MASGDKLYTNPAACNLALSLYGNLSIPVDGYPPNYDITKGGWDGKVITKDITDAVLGPSFKGFYRVWLIEFSPDFWDPNKDIPGWLNSHAFLLVDQYFGRIHVRLYQIGKNEN
jgi:hypothetical protein